MYLLFYLQLGEINIVQNARSYPNKREYSTKIFRAVEIIPHVIHALRYWLTTQQMSLCLECVTKPKKWNTWNKYLRYEDNSIKMVLKKVWNENAEWMHMPQWKVLKSTLQRRVPKKVECLSYVGNYDLIEDSVW